jgi:hypothetical protein
MTRASSTEEPCAAKVASTVLKASGGGDPFAEPNLKAFKRLAAKLKKQFPRLPICITADGLYPNQGFFEQCQHNDWRFIITFKDGNLPTVWEEVHALRAITPHAQRTERRIQGHSEIVEQLSWLNAIDYHTHRLNWVECIETITDQKTGAQSCTRFVHLSDFPVDGSCAHLISQTGRLRWKIEPPPKSPEEDLPPQRSRW